MGIIDVSCGFGKRRKSVAGQKLLKRRMVQAIVKKLKAEGKHINLQAINEDVLDSVKRKRQGQGKKNKK